MKFAIQIGRFENFLINLVGLMVDFENLEGLGLTII